MRHRATARRGATSQARARLQIAARTRPRPASSAHVAVTTALSSRRCYTSPLPRRCCHRAVPRRCYHAAVTRRAYHGAFHSVFHGALHEASRGASHGALLSSHKATRVHGYKTTRLPARAERGDQSNTVAQLGRLGGGGRGESGRPRPPYCRGQGSQPVATPSCEQPKDDRQFAAGQRAAVQAARASRARVCKHCLAPRSRAHWARLLLSASERTPCSMDPPARATRVSEALPRRAVLRI